MTTIKLDDLGLEDQDLSGITLEKAAEIANDSIIGFYKANWDYEAKYTPQELALRRLFDRFYTIAVYEGL